MICLNCTYYEVIEGIPKCCCIDGNFRKAIRPLDEACGWFICKETEGCG